MTNKTKPHFTLEQRLVYAKLMVEEGYTNKQVQEISGAGESAMTPEQQRIQELEKQLWRANRDNEILKKAAAFFIRDNHTLN